MTPPTPNRGLVRQRVAWFLRHPTRMSSRQCRKAIGPDPTPTRATAGVVTISRIWTLERS